MVTTEASPDVPWGAQLGTTAIEHVGWGKGALLPGLILGDLVRVTSLSLGLCPTMDLRSGRGPLLAHVSSVTCVHSILENTLLGNEQSRPGAVVRTGARTQHPSGREAPTFWMVSLLPSNISRASRADG